MKKPKGSLMPLEGDNSALLHRLKVAALSGATTGGVLGALQGALSPGATLGRVGLSALKGAGAFGATAPASMLAGEAILGKPKDDEANPYTHRGLAGGAALGAGAGALGGATLMAPEAILKRLGSFEQPVRSGISKFLSSDNIMSNAMSKLLATKSRGGLLKAALLGGGALGLAGAHFAGDEGQQVDIINNEMTAQKQRKRRLLDESDY